MAIVSSTFLTYERYLIDWPKWFVDKYKDYVIVQNGILAPACSFKRYGGACEYLVQDIQKAIDWQNMGSLKNYFILFCDDKGDFETVMIYEDEIVSSRVTLEDVD
jgi:hypothetical protein